MGIAKWAFISGAYSKGGSRGSSGSNWYPSSRHEDNGTGNYNSADKEDEKKYNVEFLKDENYRPCDCGARVRDLRKRKNIVRKYPNFFQTGDRDLITFSNSISDVKEGDGFVAGVSFSETTSIWSFRKTRNLVIEIFVWKWKSWLFGTRIFSVGEDSWNLRIKNVHFSAARAEVTLNAKGKIFIDIALKNQP